MLSMLSHNLLGSLVLQGLHVQSIGQDAKIVICDWRDLEASRSILVVQLQNSVEQR